MDDVGGQRAVSLRKRETVTRWGEGETREREKSENGEERILSGRKTSIISPAPALTLLYPTLTSPPPPGIPVAVWGRTLGFCHWLLTTVVGRHSSPLFYLNPFRYRGQITF